MKSSLFISLTFFLGLVFTQSCTKEPASFEAEIQNELIPYVNYGALENSYGFTLQRVLPNGINVNGGSGNSSITLLSTNGSQNTWELYAEFELGAFWTKIRFTSENKLAGIYPIEYLEVNIGSEILVWESTEIIASTFETTSLNSSIGFANGVVEGELIPDGFDEALFSANFTKSEVIQ